MGVDTRQGLKTMIDLSILIQGPASQKSDGFKILNKYKEHGNILVSCYEEDETQFLSEFDFIEVIKSETPRIKEKVGVDHGSTFYYALYTTFKGLQKIKSEYTLKIRSDEYFSNLSPIIECISKNPNKLVCGNIFYKPWNIFKGHMGDHIFACKTKTLLESYQRLLDMYDKKINLDHRFSQAHGLVAETILCKSILFSIDPVNFETEKCFIDNVLKVDINLMKPFVCKWQHNKMVFDSDFKEEKFY